MFKTYIPNTISGSNNLSAIQPKNTFYRSCSAISPREFDMIVELVNCGRIAGIMAGNFADETHEGRVQKLDKKKIKDFDDKLKDIIKRLALQCGIEISRPPESEEE